MICPNCGHSFDAPNNDKNYNHFIKSEIDKRDINTRKMLISVIDKVRQYYPTTSTDIANFLGSISTVESKIIKYQIDAYNRAGSFEKGGLHYLRAMILNLDKNKDKLKEIQMKIYGTKPLPYEE